MQADELNEKMKHLAGLLDKLLPMAKSMGLIHSLDGNNYISTPKGAGPEYEELVDEVEMTANQYCITTDGRPNFAAHKVLKGYGYSVTRGEYDSFGWLTSVINFPSGERFTFG
jgi:hypothetical protein